MTYTVKEIYHTLQGEGMNVGRLAVFCRFAGCNLWSGIEKDRHDSNCNFCDTDFVGFNGPGGGRFETPTDLTQAIKSCWPGGNENPFVVCTGGEPLLQVDGDLIDALHDEGFEVAVETNGTQPAPVGKTGGFDWICVSPKAGCPIDLKTGDELKVVFPQDGINLRELETLTFRNYLIQPMDGENLHQNTKLAIEYCHKHPIWRLSIQTHKILGIP
ncbi:MAG: 7-carboxy-7-deazaguanine synthase [Pseudomonadota bacterium]|nr:7-carboxy-7-deazaguanine synthase [Pseudomonadota bacterium]